MNKAWEKDNCAAMKALYAVYSIPQAAALWCGVPDDQMESVLQEVTQLSLTGFGRSIWTHPSIPCIEPRSRAIAEAIESGEIPHGREDGKPVREDDHVAYERRHFFGRDLRSWIEKRFPNDKPAFLFDDIERDSHTSISAESYRTLQADRDALKTRINKATEAYKKLREERQAIELERDNLKAKVESLGAPGERAEATYQNIIAALLDCIAGNISGIKKHPSFSSEAKLIDKIEEYYRGYGGLSKSNMSRKFPEAKRNLQAR